MMTLRGLCNRQRRRLLSARVQRSARTALSLPFGARVADAQRGENAADDYALSLLSVAR